MEGAPQPKDKFHRVGGVFGKKRKSGPKQKKVKGYFTNKGCWGALRPKKGDGPPPEWGKQKRWSQKKARG